MAGGSGERAAHGFSSLGDSAGIRQGASATARSVACASVRECLLTSSLACGSIRECRGRRFEPADSHKVQGVRVYLAVLMLAATVSACGSGCSGRQEETASSARLSSPAASRIERCVDRLLGNTTTQNAADRKAARRYARMTYCARFEEKGWVYKDGAVSIAAQTWLEQGATCARGGEGEPTRTVPCEIDRSGGRGVQTLDCALLHIVKRSEVREYIDRLEMDGAVKCDDGTALDELGVP